MDELMLQIQDVISAAAILVIVIGVLFIVLLVLQIVESVCNIKESNAKTRVYNKRYLEMSKTSRQ